MKLSSNKSRIVGVLMTEMRVAVTNQPGVTVMARFALLDQDSNVVAEAPRTGGFSPKVAEAVAALVEALEMDELSRLFGEEPEAEDDGSVASPSNIPTF